MKKTLIVALMMVAGGAQAACESEQKIIDNPNLSESSRTVWVKQLASCLENAKERAIADEKNAKERAIADEKNAAEAKVRAEEIAKIQRQKDSFKTPNPDSVTYHRDRYAQAIGINKLIEEEFKTQCPKLDEWCLWSKSYQYQRARTLDLMKELADGEPELRAREKKREEEASRLSKLPGVRIGMTSNQVINQTSWGRPSSVNRTTTAAGTSEQWVYGSRTYLYFTNSILTAIQN